MNQRYVIKNIGIVILVVSILGCQQSVKPLHTLIEIENALKAGNLAQVKIWCDSIFELGNPDSLTRIKLKSTIDMADRINADFTLSEPEIDHRLKKEIGEFTSAERGLWEQNNWLEYRIIDGTKNYFKRAVSNLQLILKSRQPILNKDQTSDSQALFCLDHTRKAKVK